MAKKTYQPLLTNLAQPFDVSKVKVDKPRVYAKPLTIKTPKISKAITSPSLGRLGKKPSATQIEAQKAQALQDIKSSTFTRANVGAMQGLSPIGFKLGKEEQAILDKSIAYKAGEVVGTMAGFALPYAGLGKGVLQGTTKLAPKLILGASGAISKGITRLAPKVATETAERVGKGITESLIKDVAIGAPMNVAYAYGKEDLRGADAARNIAFNTGLDLITGGILEAVPLVLKSGKRVASKAEFDNLKPEEQIETLERLAYESNVRKGKITPDAPPIEGINADVMATRYGLIEPKLRAYKATTKKLYQPIITAQPSEINKINPEDTNSLDLFSKQMKSIKIKPDKVAMDKELKTLIKKGETLRAKSRAMLDDKIPQTKAEMKNRVVARKYSSEFTQENRTKITELIREYQRKGVEFPPDTPEDLIRGALYNSKGEYDPIIKSIQNKLNVKKQEPTSKKYSALIKELPKTIPQTMYNTARRQREVPRTITPDELASTATIQPQTLQKGTVAPKSIETSLERDLGADINRIQPATQANLERYGAMKQGEQLVDELGQAVTREIEVPKATAYGDQMQFARTVAESKNVTDEFADNILDAINEGDFTKATKSNTVAVDNANRIIDTEGLQSATGRFKNAIESGKTLTSEDMAIGARLVQEYQKIGDNITTMDILSDMANGLSEAGRTVQSARILKRLSPEGRLMTVQKMANKIGEKTGTNIKITNDMIEKIKNATTETEIAKVNNEVATEIWNQVPPTFQDKLNAWRYMAMLTNPRTHFRNVIGNAISVPAREIKNVIGAGIEKIFLKEGQRTKSIMPDAELVDFAKADWPNAKPLFDKSSKYDEGLRDIKAKVFKTKGLEMLRSANVGLLEKEDDFFKYLAYKSSLSKYMKANNLKPDNMVGDTLDKARRYAIDEAKKATFTDDSAIANFLTKAKKSARESDSWTKKAGGIALESALPFTKTPINILKRGFEYSPIGLAKTITKGVKDLKKGKINANEFIDDISKGFTGTALTGLGAILGYNGMITSTQDETRKEQDYSKMLGKQNYSIDTGDGTYTIDWAAPLSLPFFIGVEVAKSAMQDGLSLGETLDGLQSIANPILELSMLQGLTSSIEEFGVPSKTQGEKLIGAINNTIVGYISQFMPTLGGQLARTFTPERKVTTSTADTQTVKMWQSAIKKLQSKVPGAQANLEPYVDIWGRTETVDNAIDRFVANMVSPGYYKEKNVDAVDKEISRLANSIGSDAIPRGVSNYTVQSNNEQYRMTDKELTQFKKDKGQASYNGVQKLIMTSEYRMASDEKKADMLDKVYRNSQNVAKEKFFRNRGISYEY